MKKLLFGTICVLLIFSLSACSGKGDGATFKEDGKLYLSFPDVGLEKVFLCEASETDVLLEKDEYGQIFLLASNKSENSVMMDQYLVIRLKGKTLLKDLLAYDSHFNLAGNIEVCDFDGDGDCEILLQQTVAMSGGAGGYLSRVFDFRNGEIVEIFSSDDIFKKYPEMGFSCKLLPDKEIYIENKITGYSETFRLEGRPDTYFERWVADDGSMVDLHLEADSFYEFTPLDLDGDGIYEIACRQYTCLIDHTDGIGSAKTVLKFNTETAEFELKKADFELFRYSK